MRHHWIYRGAMPCIAALLLNVAAGSLIAGAAGEYEQPPSFQASQVLPPDLQHGQNYRVSGGVGLENFQYVFHLQTSWGPAVIRGTDLLRVRAREMVATAKLEEVNGADTTVVAAGRTALQPVETAKDLVTAPGQTISDTFKGMGHIVGSAKASLNATDPHKDTILASVSGGALARRKLAYNLGVDPNTTWPPLDAELKRVATADAVGQTAANVGMSFVAGPAGYAISATGTSDQLRIMLRDKSASDMEKDGRDQLGAMGISPAAMDAFYANAALTPTDKGIIVEALGSLGGAGGRELYIVSAAKANSIEMAYFYRRQAEMIAAFNHRVAPVRGFTRVGGAPVLETGKGMVSLLPVDYLYWSPPLAGVYGGPGHGAGEVWITGRASEMATAKLADAGWKLVPNAGAQLGR